MKHLEHLPIIMVLILLAALPLFVLFLQQKNLTDRSAHAQSISGDWPMYLHDIQHNSNNTNENILSSSNASQLTPQWSFKTGGVVAAGAAVVNNIAYVGSWDGYEYALDAATGSQIWKTFLGQTASSAGITSSATVLNNVVYVGGGDSNFYALDASSGNILWQVPLANNNPLDGGLYNWGSPVIYNGFIYFGTASLDDQPLVQSQLFKIDINTHQIVNTFNVVPPGQVGGSIWSTPTIDPTTNTVYISTGNTGTTAATMQPYSQAVVALDATTLQPKGSWQVTQPVTDSDWGTTPILYTNSSGKELLAASNKNGYLYVFNPSNISAGPLVSAQIGVGGPNPENGFGPASSMAFGNNSLFFASGITLLNGIYYPGSIRASNATTGKILWQLGAPGMILPALSYANGLVVDGAGPMIEVRDASSGRVLYYYDTNNTLDSPAAISNGRIIMGATDGTVYCFGLPNPSPSLSPSPTPQVATGSGLFGSYFNNTSFTNPATSQRVDGYIDYNWGPSSPSASINPYYYSVYWAGYIIPQYTETYTFYMNMNTGGQIKVNNQIIINQAGNLKAHEYSGTISLQAGQRYPISVAFYNSGGPTSNAVSAVSWSSPSTPKQIVPQSQLFYH